jgi:hypothetical protein
VIVDARGRSFDFLSFFLAARLMMYGLHIDGCIVGGLNYYCRLFGWCLGLHVNQMIEPFIAHAHTHTRHHDVHQSIK